MRILFISLFLLGCLTNSFGQKFPMYSNYKWDKETKLDSSVVPNVLYYYTKYVVAVEYEFDPYYQRFFKYQLMHYRVKLNSHLAIEMFNKVYIPMEDVEALKSVKARVIKPSGVVDFKPEVQKFDSEDEKDGYRYFPVKGIQLGDEIEIIYVLKMASSIDGDQFFFQSEVPTFNFDFYFVTPTDSYFDFLAHNGFPKPQLVDTVIHRHQWHSHLDTVPAFKREYFSEYNNVTMKLDVVLKGFDSPTDNSYSPYESYEQQLNEAYNIALKPKDIKAVQALSTKIGVSRNNRTDENIRLIENYMKLNVSIDNDVPMDTPLATLIENERAGVVGYMRIYMALFKENAIEFEYGFISDRYESYFHPDIESAKFLQFYIFYFPTIKSYLAPLHYNSRLGYLDKEWIPNNAMLYTSKLYPRPQTKGEIKSVPATTGRQHLDSTIIRIVVNDTYDNYDIEIERHYTGYDAGEFQIYYYLYNDDRREREERILIDVLRDYSTYEITSLQNVDPEDAFIKPLIIKGKVKQLNTPLIENAGSYMVFRLGYLFGEYTDLIEIDRKKTDFVFSNGLYQTQTVEVVFPEGTKITSPQDIPVADDLCPDEKIRVWSKFNIDGSKVYYSQGVYFDSHRYPIEDKEMMKSVFAFWNSLHKMNLIIEK